MKDKATEDEICEEMEAYDLLPPEVRQFLANHKANVPASRIYEKFLEFSGDEEKLWAWIRSIRILVK